MKLNSRRFIAQEVAELKRVVGKSTAINALSGGGDSSVCTVLGHRALGRRLKTFIVDNALMREGELKRVVSIFHKIGIDPQKEYGYQVLEPLKTLRKDGVRAVAAALGLPAEITKRIPIPRAGFGHADCGRSYRGKTADCPRRNVNC